MQRALQRSSLLLTLAASIATATATSQVQVSPSEATPAVRDRCGPLRPPGAPSAASVAVEPAPADIRDPAEILALLAETDVELRDVGLLNLAAAPHDPNAFMPRLLELLRDPRPGVRASAAHAIGLLRPLGSASASTCEALLPLLRGPVPVAEEAAWALGRLGTPADRRTAMALTDLLRHRSIVLRNAALGALAAFSPLDPALQVRIAAVLPDVFPRSWEGDAGADVLLARLSQRNPALQREILLALLHGDEAQRRGAIRTLAQLDPPEAEAARLVATQLDSACDVLRTEAHEALKRMGSVGADFLRAARNPR